MTWGVENDEQMDKQIAAYLNWCEFEKNMTKQTMRSKRYILKSFKQNINRNDARKITNDDFSEWRQIQMHRGVAPSTVNNRIAHAVAFFKYLLRTGAKLKINLSAIDLCNVPEAEVQFFDREQIETVKQMCKGNRDYLLVTLKFETGLRIHELAKLTVEDFTDCHLKVLGKGRVRRSTFILPETRKVLDKWIAQNDIQIGYIFPSPVEYDKHLSVDMIRLILKQAFQRAGIENFNPHALRHTFATELIRGGADLPTVQKLLGHKDPKTTSRYVHLLTDTLQANHAKSLGT